MHWEKMVARAERNFVKSFSPMKTEGNAWNPFFTLQFVNAGWQRRLKRGAEMRGY